LKELETTTGYPAAWFFAASFLFLSALVTVVGGAKLLVDIVGFVYPAYMSFKSMDSGTTATSGDDTQWLTYWVVFSFLTILESVFGFVVMLIPFYFWIKIGILVVCVCVV
jgi:receptor expression-enhancing protein 5/6